MIMKYFAILSAALVVFLLSGAELEILSTTDLHGRLETMPQLGYALRSGGKGALRIDCGDTVQGSSISRHSGGEAEPVHALTLGPLRIDPARHQVLAHGREVTLTLKEFQLLSLLVEHAGTVFTRDQLLNTIWGYEFDGASRTVDVHIRTLRQKLGECGGCIETVRGIGYKISGDQTAGLPQ